MTISTESVVRLAGLAGLVPKDYFNGARGRNLCLADNVIVFLRRLRGELHRRNFDSRPHHRYVLAICLESQGSINVDGSVFHLQEGDAFLIEPYQFHFYMEVAAERIAWLFVTFEASHAAPFETFSNTPIRLSADNLQSALDLAASYAALDRKDDCDRDRFVLATAVLLTRLRAAALEQARSLIQPMPQPAPDGYGMIDKINRLLNERLEQAIGIPDLAGQLAISQSHLRKRFKSLTGLSLGSYIVHYKLNRAVKLLVHSEASLTEISIQCGYESLAAFSRSFKNKLGVSPSDYRKHRIIHPIEK